MALGRKVVNLVRLNLLHNANEIGTVGHISVMKIEPRMILMHVLI